MKNGLVRHEAWRSRSCAPVLDYVRQASRGLTRVEGDAVVRLVQVRGESLVQEEADSSPPWPELRPCSLPSPEKDDALT